MSEGKYVEFDASAHQEKYNAAVIEFAKANPPNFGTDPEPFVFANIHNNVTSSLLCLLDVYTQKPWYWNFQAAAWLPYYFVQEAAQPVTLEVAA